VALISLVCNVTKPNNSTKGVPCDHEQKTISGADLVWRHQVLFQPPNSLELKRIWTLTRYQELHWRQPAPNMASCRMPKRKDKQECETNPSHPDRELRRPAPRRKSAPTAPAAVSDLRRRPHVHRGSRRAGGRSSSMPEKLVAAAGRLLRRDMQRPGWSQATRRRHFESCCTFSS